MGMRMGFPVVALGGIESITSTDGSVTITDPTGPNTDLSVAGGGGGVGQVLTLTYNGAGPFDVPCLVPEGYDPAFGGQVFGVLIVGTGGITSGMLVANTAGSPLPDGDYPASITIDNTGTIISMTIIDPGNTANILFYGATANLFFLSGTYTSGTISPLGAVTPIMQGQIYVQTGPASNESSIYIALSQGDVTSWICLGGTNLNSGTVAPGVGSGNGFVGLIGFSPGGMQLVDIVALLGSGNAVTWQTGGTDGDQTFNIQVGPNGSPLVFIVGADGSVTCPANIVAPAMPTSPVGLPSGALWNNLGIVNIAP